MNRRIRNRLSKLEAEAAPKQPRPTYNVVCLGEGEELDREGYRPDVVPLVVRPQGRMPRVE